MTWDFQDLGKEFTGQVIAGHRWQLWAISQEKTIAKLNYNKEKGFTFD